MTRLNIQIEMDNEAFEVHLPGEVAQLLRAVHADLGRLSDGDRRRYVDSNGTRCGVAWVDDGKVDYEGKLPADPALRHVAAQLVKACNGLLLTDGKDQRNAYGYDVASNALDNDKRRNFRAAVLALRTYLGR